MIINHNLPQFTQINYAKFPKQLQNLLTHNLQQIDEILANNTNYTWNNLIQPLEEMDDALEKIWSPIAHLHAVTDSPAIRKCYQTCLAPLTAYEASIGQNVQLYRAIQSLNISHDISNQEKLTQVQYKLIDDLLTTFTLSGVGLMSQEKIRFNIIDERLSVLSNQFEANILDANDAYFLHITDESRLIGLPAYAIHNAQENAKQKNLGGWILTLHESCYRTVMTYAEDRNLRKELYTAYITRASDLGPQAGQFDNSQILTEILALRHEQAQLLSFNNYAELSIVTKMAESTTEVMTFLDALRQKVYPQAMLEFTSMCESAKNDYDIQNIETWDISWVAEKQRQNLFNISEEILRPYFPIAQVIQGLFAILKQLYNITFELILDDNSWHPDVKCYCILDSDQAIRGYVYMDLFARANKRSGAWMDQSRTRYLRANGEIQIPIAMLVCNFAKTTLSPQPLLTHDDTVTLFHEMGHCMHHLLTKVEYFSLSGTNGVEWDAVELPSQFFENWCWNYDALKLLTAHIDTEEPLPIELFEKLIASKNFQSGIHILRQIELASFDFLIHRDYNPKEIDFIQHKLADIRKQTSLIPSVEYNRFQNSFAHIFGGGYSAGYYSYLWADILSSDAFARFQEEGIFNPQVGKDFLQFILEIGGSQKASDAFLNFRGRKATIDAFLKQNGISSSF